MARILYEDRDIYDGWCAAFDPKTGEYFLRDHWAVNRLSDERKKQLLEDVQLAMKRHEPRL